MINFKDEDEPQNETVRQTLERVARELGVFGTTPTNNITHSPQSSTQQPTAWSSSPNYSTTAANNWQIQPTTAVPQNSNTFGNEPQPNQPTGFTPSPPQPTEQTPAEGTNQTGQPSPALQAIYRYLANTYGQQNPQIPSTQKFAGINSNGASQNKQTTFNDFSQSDAFDSLRNFHVEREGYKRTIDDQGLVFPYPDINGDITGCIGHNMKHDFNKHPWIDATNGQPLSKSQILSAEKKLKSISTDLKPELYASQTNARLPQEYCSDLYNRDIESRWNTLNTAIPNWSYMSPEMQAATMDVHFTGNMEPKNSWTLAKGAAEEMNKKDYCDNLHRRDERRDDIKRRNQWVSDMCMKGKFYK